MGTVDIIAVTSSMVDKAEDSYVENCKKNVGEPKRLRRSSVHCASILSFGNHSINVNLFETVLTVTDPISTFMYM